MPRYIDAEHLIQKINDNRELSRWAKDVAILCVMDTPVVDVAKISRCSKCIHCSVAGGISGGGYNCYCKRIDEYVMSNDFCSFGYEEG